MFSDFVLEVCRDSKLGATRCQMSDSKAKMHQIRFSLGLRLDPLALFKLPISKGEGKGRKGEEKGERRRRALPDQ